jgi:hypothetical protein
MPRFFFSVLRFELSILHLLRRYTTTWSMPSTLICFIFQVGSHIFSRGWLKTSLLYLAFPIAEITGTCHHAWLSNRNKDSLNFCPAWPSIRVFLISSSCMLNKKNTDRYWWLSSVILATQKAEISRIMVLVIPGKKKVCEIPSQCIKVGCGDAYLSPH